MSRILSGCATGAAMCLTACAPLKPPASVVSQTPTTKVARVSLATLTVLPWQDIAPSLQPDFKLTEDQALKNAIAISSKTSSATSVSDQFFLNATLAGQIVDTNREVKTQDGVTTVSETKTTSLKTPDKPSTDPPAAGPAPPAPTALGQDFKPMVEALFTYQLATALFQEAQILKRYVGGAASYPDYDPYFVRLQLTINPRARNIPYDTYVELDLKQNGCETPDGCVRIVPLLVTDSMEATSELASVRASSNASAKAGWMQGAFGLGGGASRARANGQDSATLRPNSLFSLGKTGSNSLQVRLGANRFGGDYEMLSRNHNVSLLLYVKKDPEGRSTQPVTINGKARFVDATSGVDQSEIEITQVPDEVIPIPAIEETACPPTQMITLVDNGQTMTGSLGNGVGLGLSKIYAQFFAPTVTVGNLPLTLQSKSVTAANGNLDMVFPSSAALLPAGRKGPLTAHLAFTYTTYDSDRSTRKAVFRRGSCGQVAPQSKQRTDGVSYVAVVSLTGDAAALPKPDSGKPAAGAKPSGAADIKPKPTAPDKSKPSPTPAPPPTQATTAPPKEVPPEQAITITPPTLAEPTAKNVETRTGADTAPPAAAPPPAPAPAPDPKTEPPAT